MLHRIAAGETAFSISRQYGVSLTQLQDWNNLGSPDKLLAGDVLRIKAGNKGIPLPPLARGANARSVYEEGGYLYYTVKTGDTFYGICRKRRVTPGELQKLNPKLDIERLRIGDKIVVGQITPAESSKVSSQPPITQVSRGGVFSPTSSHPQPFMTSPDPGAQTLFSSKENLDTYHRLFSEISDLRKERNLYAVVIGISEYPYLSNLRYPDNDAYAFYSFLLSPEGGAADVRNIAILIDEHATRENIIRAVREKFSQADANDDLVFFYAGHGIEHALLPHDYNGYNPLTFEEIFPPNQSRSNHYRIFIDACHSGSLASRFVSENELSSRDEMIFQLNRLGQNQDQWGILSSQRGEISLEVDGMRHGAFTYSLIEGLRGRADFDRDYVVTLGEIFSFVSSQLRGQAHLGQHPILLGNFDMRSPVGLVRR